MYDSCKCREEERCCVQSSAGTAALLKKIRRLRSCQERHSVPECSVFHRSDQYYRNAAAPARNLETLGARRHGQFETLELSCRSSCLVKSFDRFSGLEGSQSCR